MEASQPPAKRKRLSHACTRCRSKKIRCDEQEPRCTNCVRADVDCVTFDPRTQASVQRREAQRQPAVSSLLRLNDGRAGSSGLENGPPAVSPYVVHVASIAESSPAESSPLLPVLPRFLNGNSLSVLTQWLDLAFARLGMSHRLHRTYNEIRHREHRSTCSTSTLSAVEVESILSTFHQTRTAYSASIGHVFPIFERSCLDPALMSDEDATPRDVPVRVASTKQLKALGWFDPFSEHFLPLHAMMYAIVYAASGHPDCRQSAERLSGYAFSQLPAILESAQSLDAVRTLVLMSLYSRWRDDVERAWQLLSLAVATVQNIGLHREHKTSPPGSQDPFWCVFVLDKLLSVELERRPMLHSAECNRSMSTMSLSHGGAIFKAIVELSKLQDDILDNLLLSRRAEEDAQESQGPALLNRVIKDKLRLVAELDQKLLRFAEALPHGLKPTEYLYADQESLPGITFLTVQYHQTVFLVSRNALLINMEAVQSEISRCFEGQPSSNRLRSGMHVCANAARSILNVLNHAEEMGVRSPLLTPYAPLMAMYALTIHIVRRQSSATARVDLELQATAMNLIKRYQSLQSERDDISSGDPGLFQMLERLHTFSASYIQQSSRPQPMAGDASLPTSENVEQWRSGDMPARVMSPPQSPVDDGSNMHIVPQANRTPAGMGTASFPEYEGATVPMSDFSNERFTDMGQDGMDLDWDELALALGLPTVQR